MKNVLILSVAALAPTLFAAAPTLKPGQYEVVSEFAPPGQAARMPGQKMLHCYTAKEVEDLAKVVAGRNPNENCKVLSSKVTGSTLTFTTECAQTDGSALTMSGEATFTSQESYRAVVNMKGSGGRGPNPFANGMTINITATRIGECAK